MALLYTKQLQHYSLHKCTILSLSLSNQIILVLTLMVTSKGIAGVPGVSFVVLLSTLGAVGIPLEGLAFIPLN